MIFAFLLASVVSAGPTPTTTPIFTFKAEMNLVLPKNMWLVTATATITPTFTKAPSTATLTRTPEVIRGEATCVVRGHDWTTFDYADIKIVLDVASVKDRKQLPLWFQTPSHEGDRYPGWYWSKGGWKFRGPKGWDSGEGIAHGPVERCRRCGLWREKP